MYIELNRLNPRRLFPELVRVAGITEQHDQLDLLEEPDFDLEAFHLQLERTALHVWSTRRVQALYPLFVVVRCATLPDFPRTTSHPTYSSLDPALCKQLLQSGHMEHALRRGRRHVREEGEGSPQMR